MGQVQEKKKNDSRDSQFKMRFTRAAGINQTLVNVKKTTTCKVIKATRVPGLPNAPGLGTYLGTFLSDPTKDMHKVPCLQNSLHENSLKI